MKTTQWRNALMLCTVLAASQMAGAQSAQRGTTASFDLRTTRVEMAPIYERYKAQGQNLAVKPRLEIGMKVPDLIFRDAEGKTRKLTEFGGRIVVLVWLAPDAPVNRRLLQTGRVQELSTFKPGGVAVVYVQERITTPTFTFPAPENPPYMFSDLRYLNAMRMSVNKLPTVIILDHEGKLVYRGALDNDPTGMLEKPRRIDYAVQALRNTLSGESLSTTTTQVYGDPLVYVPMRPNANGLKQGNKK